MVKESTRVVLGVGTLAAIGVGIYVLTRPQESVVDTVSEPTGDPFSPAVTITLLESVTDRPTTPGGSSFGGTTGERSTIIVSPDVAAAAQRELDFPALAQRSLTDIQDQKPSVRLTTGQKISSSTGAVLEQKVMKQLAEKEIASPTGKTAGDILRETRAAIGLPLSIPTKATAPVPPAPTLAQPKKSSFLDKFLGKGQFSKPLPAPKPFTKKPLPSPKKKK